jgi:hypothetical protein
MKYVISSSVIQILCLCLLREEVPDASAFAFHADPFRCLIPPMSDMKYRRGNLVLLMHTTSYHRLVLRSIKG